MKDKELLDRIHRELLDVLKSVNELEIHHAGDHFYELLRDVEAALTRQQIEQDFHLHDEENEGGWTNWVCPKPDSYLMKCCDCGLVHEMQTRVAKYALRPSEDFVVSSDPDLQTQFRVRRHEVLETTPPQRAWVGLTDDEIVRCVVHARFEYDPPYVDKNGVKHLAVYEVQAGPTYKKILAALQEKNT